MEVKDTFTDTDEILFNKFERTVEQLPDKPAIIYLGEKFSYEKIKDLIDRLATALHNLGVIVNDRVMIYVPNCPQWLIAYLAVQRIGAVPVPIAPIYNPSEILGLINDSGADTIICQDTNFGYVKEVSTKTSLERIIVTNLVDLLPTWKRAIGKLFDKVPHGAVEKKENIYSFRDLIGKHPPHPPEININPREHLAYLLYTGGTTGVPKGVPSTHKTMVCNVNDFLDTTKGYIEQGGDDVFLIASSLFEIISKASILGLGLSRGITTVLIPMPQVDDVLGAIQRHDVTMMLSAPSFYREILENPRLDLYDLGSLRYCWSSGDILPIEVFNRWKQKFGIPIYQNYGSTEIACIVGNPLDTEPVPGSLGFPMSTKKVRIVDSSTLEPVSSNRTGELLVALEDMDVTYWNNPEETSDSIVKIEGKKWYRTRDHVRMDENGLIYYMDRSSDIIKHQEHAVSSSEIEAVLEDHPAVAEACVVGVPDEEVGERIKALVVPKSGARGVEAAELIKWCEERFPSFKVPQFIEFRDMLPKSKVGKLLRRVIREEERRRVA